MSRSTLWKTTASFDGKYAKNVRGGDLRGGRDVRDRRRVVAALREQAHGRFDDLLARALLLAFPQPLCHVAIVAKMQNV